MGEYLPKVRSTPSKEDASFGPSRRLRQSQEPVDHAAFLRGFVADVRQSGALDSLKPIKRTILETYLTTGVSLADIAAMPIGRRRGGAKGVHCHVHTGMQAVFEHLPLDLQEKYQSPEAVLEHRTRVRSQLQLERLTAGNQGKNLGRKNTLSKQGKDNIKTAQQARRKREKARERASSDSRIRETSAVGIFPLVVCFHKLSQ